MTGQLTAREVRHAADVMDRIRRHDELADGLAEREVDFVRGETRCAIGRMQMDPADIQALGEHLKQAAADWLAQRRAALLAELRALGIDTSDIDTPAPRRRLAACISAAREA